MALQQVPEEAGDVVEVKLRRVFARRDQEILCQRQLPLAEDRLQEFAEFYEMSPEEARAIESIQNKDALEDMFSTVETDEGLTRNYRDARGMTLKIQFELLPPWIQIEFGQNQDRLRTRIEAHGQIAVQTIEIKILVQR